MLVGEQISKSTKERARWAIGETGAVQPRKSSCSAGSLFPNADWKDLSHLSNKNGIVSFH